MLLYVLFGVLFSGSLVVELLMSRHSHEIKPKEAGVRVAIWFSLAMGFAFAIFMHPDFGPVTAMEFLTGYLIELALSVDNLFVFILIFTAFAVPPVSRLRVLTWGIMGAIVMRGLMILVGAALISRFEWIMYLFGAFLIYAGVKMLMPGKEEEMDPSKSKVLKFVRRFLPVTDDYRGDAFMVREKGVLYATPLLMTLISVEITDVVFAVDSIPAIFAITTDAFVVLTSNLFAIMGLRSLYFLLQGMLDKFHLLKYGIALVLAFIGVKMVLLFWHFHVDITYSLGIVVGTLLTSVVLSLVFPAKGSLDKG